MIRTSVIIPDDIYREAKKVSDNFSSLVSEALREHLRVRKVERALESFGKWADRGQDSVAIVNELREDKGRGYAERHA